MGPIYIPKKGDKIDLSLDNLPLYKKIIKDYEAIIKEIVRLEEILASQKLIDEIQRTQPLTERNWLLQQLK